MKTGTATTRRRLLAVLIALALPGPPLRCWPNHQRPARRTRARPAKWRGRSVRSPSRWATTWIHTQRPTR